MGCKRCPFAHSIHGRDQATTIDSVGCGWFCVAYCLRKRSQSVIGASRITKKGDRSEGGTRGESLAYRTPIVNGECVAICDRRDIGLAPGMVGNSRTHCPKSASVNGSS